MQSNRPFNDFVLVAVSGPGLGRYRPQPAKGSRSGAVGEPLGLPTASGQTAVAVSTLLPRTRSPATVIVSRVGVGAGVGVSGPKSTSRRAYPLGHVPFCAMVTLPCLSAHSTVVSVGPVCAVAAIPDSQHSEAGDNGRGDGASHGLFPLGGL
jgi:hypothetical protein